MTTITVLYPRHEDGHFDYDYYEREHLRLVAQRWGGAGLEGAEALRGIAGADGGEAPFYALAIIRFGSLEAFNSAMTSASGAEILADIRNFTNVQPMVQINEPIGGAGQ